MRRIFRTRTFTRWMKKTPLTDEALADAVSEMTRGLVDAELGGHIVKKRVALPGQGKRASARTLVATKTSRRWIFLYGFGKNERSNVSNQELRALKEIAKDLLELSEEQIEVALEQGQLTEISNGNENAEKPNPRRNA
jgi:hypothetical protein